jgi:uncharacterized membrane protein
MQTLSSRSYRFARPIDGSIAWSFKRNCSISPAQLLQVFAMLGAVSLGVAGFFWAQGAVLVLPFACLEIAVLGIAFVVYARHATDAEVATLEGDWLVVQLETAGKVEHMRFPRASVRVEPLEDEANLIELTARDMRLCFGRHVRSEWRPMVAQEMRLALRGM